MLQQLMLAYSAFDPAKTLDAADRLLQVDPNNLRALTFEVYFRLKSADSDYRSSGEAGRARYGCWLRSEGSGRHQAGRHERSRLQ